jgi:hypothetical protein
LNAIGSTQLTIVFGSGNQFLVPFILGMDYLCTKISAQVIAGVAGSSVQVGVYELDEDFNPIAGAPLISGTLLTNTIGLKTSILSAPVQLLKGKKYGFSHLTVSGSPTLRFVQGFNWYGGNGDLQRIISFQENSTGVLSSNFMPNSFSAVQSQMAITLFRN